MVNHRKVIFSLLKEIKENKSEPKAGDYGLETAEFGDIVDMMLDEKLITGASVGYDYPIREYGNLEMHQRRH